MSIRKDFEEAQKQFDDYLYPNGKDKSPVKIYDVKPFGDKEWGMFKSDIWSKGQIGRMLINKFKTHYDDGWYPSKEEFIETVNRLYKNLFNCYDALQSQSETDNEIFDDLFEEYNDVNNQRTYNFSVADKLLRSKAFKIQSQIEKYLEKKIKAGEPLTSVMIGFEDVDTLETENKFNPIPQDAYIPPTEEESKPTLPEDKVPKTKEKYSVRYKTPEEPPVQKGDGELASAHNLIKRQKKKIQALRLRKKKPTTEMEMVELIIRNLKKNGKCNNEACGRELKVDGETIKRWIGEFGLTRYATNPKHRK